MRMTTNNHHSTSTTVTKNGTRMKSFFFVSWLFVGMMMMMMLLLLTSTTASSTSSSSSISSSSSLASSSTSTASSTSTSTTTIVQTKKKEELSLLFTPSLQYNNDSLPKQSKRSKVLSLLLTTSPTTTTKRNQHNTAPSTPPPLVVDETTTTTPFREEWRRRMTQRSTMMMTKEQEKTKTNKKSNDGKDTNTSSTISSSSSSFAMRMKDYEKNENLKQQKQQQMKPKMQPRTSFFLTTSSTTTPTTTRSTTTTTQPPLSFNKRQMKQTTTTEDDYHDDDFVQKLLKTTTTTTKSSSSSSSTSKSSSSSSSSSFWNNPSRRSFSTSTSFASTSFTTSSLIESSSLLESSRNKNSRRHLQEPEEELSEGELECHQVAISIMEGNGGVGYNNPIAGPPIIESLPSLWSCTCESVPSNLIVLLNCAISDRDTCPYVCNSNNTTCAESRFGSIFHYNQTTQTTTTTNNMTTTTTNTSSSPSLLPSSSLLLSQFEIVQYVSSPEKRTEILTVSRTIGNPNCTVSVTDPKLGNATNATQTCQSCIVTECETNETNNTTTMGTTVGVGIGYTMDCSNIEKDAILSTCPTTTSSSSTTKNGIFQAWVNIDNNGGFDSCVTSLPSPTPVPAPPSSNTFPTEAPTVEPIDSQTACLNRIATLTGGFGNNGGGGRTTPLATNDTTGTTGTTTTTSLTSPESSSSSISSSSSSWDCTCSEDPNIENQYLLNCHDKCGYCSSYGGTSNTTTCVDESFLQVIDPTGDSPTRTSFFRYTDSNGIPGQTTLVFIESGCKNLLLSTTPPQASSSTSNGGGGSGTSGIDTIGGECTSCQAIVGSTVCNSCIPQTCTKKKTDDNNGQSTTTMTYQAPLIDCRNVTEAVVGIYDFCDEELVIPPGDPFHVFGNPGGFDECLSNGRVECELQRAIQEQKSTTDTTTTTTSTSSSSDIFCTCEEDGLFGSTAKLSCLDNCGVYCNTDDTTDVDMVCGTPSTIWGFSNAREVEYTGMAFQYTMGRTEIMEYIRRDNNGGSGLRGDSCSYFVDFIPCDCQLQTCTDGTIQPWVDCSSNIPMIMVRDDPEDDEWIIDFCNDANTTTTTADSSSSSPFEYRSILNRNECTDNSPTNDICSDVDIFALTGTVNIFGTLETALPYRAESCAQDSDYVGLWYNVLGGGKGIRASTCSDRTDFDTQISVYSGNCNALSCIEGNDDDFSCGVDGTQSSALFFAEKDVLYHIRVHGFSSNSGSFGLTLEEANVVLPFCEDYKLTLEEPISGTICECVPVGQAAILTCTDECSYCNSERDICTDRTTAWEIEAGPTPAFVAKNVTDTYKSGGLIGDVIVGTTGCGNDGVCSTCQVLVNGETCNSCKPIVCESGGMVEEEKQGFELDCENTAAAVSLNTCDTTIESDLLQVFSPDGFDTCIRFPLESCASLDLSMSEFNNECDCVGDEFSALLTCNRPDCVICNPDYSICANVTTGAMFGSEGQLIADYENYTYIEGLSASLDFKMGDDSCSLTVNGTACTSCEYSTCSDGTDGIAVDCENVEIGASYDTCNVVAQTGVLQVFNDNEFIDCLNPEADLATICQDAVDFEGLFGSACECDADDDTSRYSLTCSKPDCLLCNREATVCAVKADGTMLNKYGRFVTFFESYKYVEGDRNETVVFGDFDKDCYVVVDNIQCNTCKDIVCTDDTFLYQIPGKAVDCENVEIGASYQDCGGAFVDSGVLEVASDFEFQVCVDQIGDAQETCLAEKEAFESTAASCDCVGPGSLGEYTLSCIESSCAYCDDSLDVCGNYVFHTVINRYGQVYQEYEGFQYEHGRSELVLLTIPRGSDQDCVMTVNGETCASCSLERCMSMDDSETFYEEPSVQCYNIPGGTNFTACSGMFTGLFAYKSPVEFDVCISPVASSETCNFTGAYFEDNDEAAVCDCMDPAEEAEDPYSATLTCNWPNCQYCNEDQTICQVNEDFEYTFDIFGNFSSVTENYRYILGRTEIISITTAFPSEECIVTIDGEKCESCVYAECGGMVGENYTDVRIDCSNVASDIAYDCGEGHPIFQFLMDASFMQCIPPTTNEPTLYPTPQPSARPSTSPPVGNSPTPEAPTDGQLNSVNSGAVLVAAQLLLRMALMGVSLLFFVW